MITFHRVVLTYDKWSQSFVASSVTVTSLLDCPSNCGYFGKERQFALFESSLRQSEVLNDIGGACVVKAEVSITPVGTIAPSLTAALLCSAHSGALFP